MIAYKLTTKTNRVYLLSEREGGGWRLEQPHAVAPATVYPGLQQALAELVQQVPWDSWSRRTRGLLAGLSGDKLP